MAQRQLRRATRSASWSLARQQRLYFLPLPQGQGSFRPGLAIAVFNLRRMGPLYQALLADARFHQLLLAFDCRSCRRPPARRDARCAVVCCIPRSSGASRAAGSGRARRSTTGASASAARWTVSHAGDTAVAALPRPQGLARRYGGADRACGTARAAARELSELVGVNRRRSRAGGTWWRDSFTASPFWQVARAAFMPPVDQDRLPASLLERFAGDAADQSSSRCCVFCCRSPEAASTLDNGFPDPQRMLVASQLRVHLPSGTPRSRGAPA